jgi:hypothetical protein
MKIKIRVCTTHEGGGSISKKDLRKLEKLCHQKRQVEIEFIYDKFKPPNR